MNLPLFSLSGTTHLAQRQMRLAFVLAITTVLLLTAIFCASFNFIPLASTDAVLTLGQPSAVTILAPARITYASQLETQQAQENAASAIPEIYTLPSADVARRQGQVAARILGFLDSVRADPYSTSAEKVDWMTSVPTVTVSAQVISRTLALDSLAYRQVLSETLYVIDQTMREEIRSNGLERIVSQLPSRISLALSIEQADLVMQWTKSLLTPNSFYDAVQTDAARARARARVSVVYKTIEARQAVVRTGEVITPPIYEALSELGYTQPQNSYADLVTAFLFSCGLVLLSAMYLARFTPQLFQQPRVLLLLSTLVLSTGIGARMTMSSGSVMPYLLPFAVAGMLGAALLDAQAGIGLTFLVALIVGYVSRGAVDLIAFVLVGGTVAVVTLQQRERLTAFVISGIYVALANVAVILIFHLRTRAEDAANILMLVLASVTSGALTGLLALGSQFVLGKLAGLTTALELIELARPTHPLLQKVLREAPGTYHHSLIVSNLAEHAAQHIGADALLARVGAYYHDVGKTQSPQSFVENQFDGVNIHDSLAPRASAEILHQHVQRGLELTKQYGVSERVRDLIPQHHGTTLSTYFYDRALKQAHGVQVDENDFRYPGPKPQTREAVIMMLADGVEATTRAERPTTPEQIRALIERIVDQRLREGQLGEAPISLREIERVKQAFFEVLQGLYHPRIRYPQPPHLKSKDDKLE